jgi:hypothetical protein
MVNLVRWSLAEMNAVQHACDFSMSLACSMEFYVELYARFPSVDTIASSISFSVHCKISDIILAIAFLLMLQYPVALQEDLAHRQRRLEGNVRSKTQSKLTRPRSLYTSGPRNITVSW